MDKEEKIKVLELLYQSGIVSIPYIFSVLYEKKDACLDIRFKRRKIKQLQRFFNELHDLGIVKKERYGKIVFYKLNEVRKDIISSVIKTKYYSKKSKRSNSLQKLFYIVNSLDNKENLTGRMKNIDILSNTIMLNNDVKAKIINEFLYYIMNINNKIVIFKKTEDKHEITEDGSVILYDQPEYLAYDYRVRFNSARWFKNVNRFIRNAFEEAGKRFKWAVHITLTVNPKKFNNHVETVIKAKKQLNSFLTTLRYQQKKLYEKGLSKHKKLYYLCFTEFGEENGLIHFHLIVFGRRRIADIKNLEEKKWKIGYVKAKQLVYKRGIGWTYPKWKNRPKDFDKRVKKILGNKYSFKFPIKLYFYFSLPKMKKKDDKLEKDDYDGLDPYFLLNYALLFTYNLKYITYSRNILKWNVEPYGIRYIDLPNDNYEFFAVCYEWDLKTTFIGKYSLYDLLFYSDAFIIKSKGG